jgi:CheY-like chemotaxis protein
MTSRLLLVDDHAAFRRLARLALERYGFEVVAEAADGAGALARATELAPDVVLLDILLPDTDGFAVAHSLAALPHPPAVVLTSSRPRSDFGERLDTAPVRGFLAKEDLTGARLEALAGRAA